LREYEVTIPMKMRIGLIIVSTFLVHSAGTWAYTFFIILQQGEVSFYEPNRPILMAEFGMAVVWTLVGLFFLGSAIWRIGSKQVRRLIIRRLTFLEIIPLKLCLKQWCWLLEKFGKI